MVEDAALIIEDYGDTMLETVVNQAAAQNNTSSIQDFFRQSTKILAAMLKIPQNSNQSGVKDPSISKNTTGN